MGPLGPFLLHPRRPYRLSLNQIHSFKHLLRACYVPGPSLNAKCKDDRLGPGPLNTHCLDPMPLSGPSRGLSDSSVTAAGRVGLLPFLHPPRPEAASTRGIPATRPTRPRARAAASFCLSVGLSSAGEVRAGAEAGRSPPLPPGSRRGRSQRGEITVREQRRDPTSLALAGPRADATGRGHSDLQLFSLWGHDPPPRGDPGHGFTGHPPSVSTSLLR